MTKNLYELALGGELAAQCGGNLDSEAESCVSVAPLTGVADAFALGDTKPEGAGLQLRYTGTELDTFVVQWAQSRGLTI
ncbi:DUF397 domain-containing protein [Kitasatospora sp. NPDC057904]|uniref:DUF397 domain-containing protein n=1 Tax=unclassified Kitasatospora TaxID=2633591 RepID=UPI00364F2A32